MEKQKKLRTVGFCLIVILLTALVLGGCAQPAPAPPAKPAPATTQAPAPKPTFKWPAPLAWTSLDVGSGGYVMAAACADTFTRQAGVETNVIPVGTDIGRLTLMQLGRVHLAWMGSAGFVAQEGGDGMESTSLGPQPIRLVIASMSSMGYGSAKEANI